MSRLYSQEVDSDLILLYVRGPDTPAEKSGASPPKHISTHTKNIADSFKWLLHKIEKTTGGVVSFLRADLKHQLEILMASVAIDSRLD